MKTNKTNNYICAKKNKIKQNSKKIPNNIVNSVQKSIQIKNQNKKRKNRTKNYNCILFKFVFNLTNKSFWYNK